MPMSTSNGTPPRPAGHFDPLRTCFISHLQPRDRTHHLDVPVARPEVVVLWLAGGLTHRFGHEIAVERASATVIERVAIDEGMVTLREDGLAKVLAGVTSLDEILRVVV